MTKSDQNYIRHLKDLLLTGEMTQKECAKILGVTFAAFNRWLNGHAVPHKNKIQQISKLHKTVVQYPALTEKEVLIHIHSANKLKRKSTWDQIQKNLDLQEDLLLEHTYNSTSIEGTTFTKKETEAIIFDHQTIKNKPLQEHLEVTNYAALMRDIFNKKYSGPVTESLIKSFHKVITQAIREDAGEYAIHQRGIRGVNITLPHPEDIPEEMSLLIKNWKKTRQNTTGLTKIAEFHSNFEFIHPFGDGNGRVGRAIMAYQCLQAGYPPVIIEDKRKAEYYDVLEFAQQNSLPPFIVFICQEMQLTEKIMQKYHPLSRKQNRIKSS